MRVAILGTGHMGSWIASELSKENEVAVYDTDKSKAFGVANVKVLSELSELASFQPELLINAVSLQNTVAAFESVLRYLPGSCAIADLASIKTGLPEYYKKCGRRFASVHPMFGPTFANVERLQEENVVLIKESDPEVIEFFRKFFKKLGLNLFYYTFKEHDEMMAYSLTLPFVASMIFAACVNSKAVPGTTFKKHLAIARGLLSEDDNLLSEILFNSFSIKQIENVTSGLEFLKHVIKDRDFEEAKRFFDKLRKNVR